jgi:hypothetical protein
LGVMAFWWATSSSMRTSTVTSATQLGPFRQLHIDPGDVLADWSGDIDTGGFGIHPRHVEIRRAQSRRWRNRRLVLQRHLGWVAAGAVVADAGLVLASSSPA